MPKGRHWAKYPTDMPHFLTGGLALSQKIGYDFENLIEGHMSKSNQGRSTLYEFNFRKELVAEKLGELKRELTKVQNGHHTGHKELQLTTFGHEIFAKAGAEFLETRTTKDLVAIAQDCQKFVERFIATTSTVLIETAQTNSHSIIRVCLKDRAFIVDSITECLRSLGIELQVFLHPVFKLGNEDAISLCHIEVRVLSNDELNQLSDTLKELLQEVILATDDYQAIRDALENIAKSSLNLPSSIMPNYLGDRGSDECSQFARWIGQHHMVLLGYLELTIDAKGKLQEVPKVALGQCRATSTTVNTLMSECLHDAALNLSKKEFLSVNKLSIESNVHRRAHLTSIIVPQYSPDGHPLALHVIVGLLTSRALKADPFMVPVLRRKLQKIIEVEELLPNSHDFRSFISVVDGMPRDEILGIGLDELREDINHILSIEKNSETRLNIRLDPNRRGLTVMVVMPKEKFNIEVRNRLQDYLERAVGAESGSSEFHLALSNKPFVRFYFYLPLENGKTPRLDLVKMKQDIVSLTRTWKDNLVAALKEKHSEREAENIAHEYAGSFPEAYQASVLISDCVEDIKHLATLSNTNQIATGMSPGEGSEYTLVIYSLGKEFILSQALPVLENAGMIVNNEKCHALYLKERGLAYVHRFSVKSRGNSVVTPALFEAHLAKGLIAVLDGQAENDRLNSLLIDAELGTQAIRLLRTYCNYLWQVAKFASRSTIAEALAGSPTLARRIWAMFELKFNHTTNESIDSRNAKFQTMLKEYKEELRNVTDITADRILRALINLVEATVRTNYFLHLPAIALKIRSADVEIMRAPKPLFEIFISSATVEGIHLRGGMVARGGIRWSDRNDDYRAEVLGLMKTQMIKNAIIVPVGAKGGFIIKASTAGKNPGEVARECYGVFVRALLSITDNRVGETIVQPKDMVIYDSPDPYFVVAADKGTATFSDTANQIARSEYDFWLGDAFASGGSKGYDHKLYAITARGAWECAKRHFNDLGIDHQNQPFRVVGIGDMSGDVFGNGLLSSRKMLLIAAFNHKHIFLDPTPDAEAQYQERERLFKLPGSQWSDFNQSVVSKGGGVYDRFKKEITITPEVRKALSIPSDVPDVVSGETLITLILKAEVELLWNGGIGTYVKASTQSHADVNDGANDGVRVNAGEIRAKVVSEGGNLGFTQLARIEYSIQGGRCNTDAVDNSGGVDLSDHEVNIKILCAQLIKQGKLTIEERDRLMKQVADQVCEMVLDHNRGQGLLLTLAEERSKKRLNSFRGLVRELSAAGFVNRTLDSLPNDDELDRRARDRAGLTRPELAVSLSAVKMWLKGVLRESSLLQEEIVKQHLLNYFPVEFQKRFAGEILAHPLGSEIIITQVANSMIDTMGVTFIYRMCQNTGATPESVVKCYLAAESIFQAEKLRHSIKVLDAAGNGKLYLEYFHDIHKALEKATMTLVNYHEPNTSLSQLVKLYQSTFMEVLENIEGMLRERQLQTYHDKLAKNIELGLDPFTAKSLAAFRYVTKFMNILSCSHLAKRNILSAASTYFEMLKTLKISQVLDKDDLIEATNKWEGELLNSALASIRRGLRNITVKLLLKDLNSAEEIQQALGKLPQMRILIQNVDEFKDRIPPVSALAIIARNLELLEQSF